MCGIAGRLNLEGRPLGRDLLCRMTRALRHRGPDDQGTVLFSSAGQAGWAARFCASLDSAACEEGWGGLGNTRLKVIDVTEHARQPMGNEDDSLWITYNGEVYNFLPLRDELARKGHRFRSRSDSEVVLHAYEEWGSDCVKRFNGMFAFGIVDLRKKVLFLARDRLGIKPLYYCHTPTFFAFASEPKALFQCGDLPLRLDIAALLDYLVLGYTPSPRSFFRGVRRLPPGSTLSLGLDPCERGVSTQRGPTLAHYWDARFGCPDNAGRSRLEVLEEFRGLVRDAVRARMVSDVPLGAFLSGGIDSSVIVSQMAGASPSAVRTFSIGFQESENTDIECARRASTRFETLHHEKILDTTLVEALGEVLSFYDEPLADTSILPTFELCRLARDHVTVALCGDGGDELFGGYWQHGQAARARYACYLPPLARTIGARLVTRHPASVTDRSEAMVRLLGLPVQRSVGLRLEGDMGDVWARRLLRPEFLRSLGDYSPYDALGDFYLSCPPDAVPLDRIQNVDMKAYLPEDILTKIDRASMAFGLEVRVPFLDHRLVEFATRLPASMRIRNGRAKVILKEAFEPIVPKEILDRPKQGFAVPETQWLRAGGLVSIEARLLSAGARVREVLSGEGMRRVFTAFRQGSPFLGRVVWALLILEEWFALMDRYGGIEIGPA